MKLYISNFWLQEDGLPAPPETPTDKARPAVAEAGPDFDRVLASTKNWVEEELQAEYEEEMEYEGDDVDQLHFEWKLVHTTEVGARGFPASTYHCEVNDALLAVVVILTLDAA